MLTFIDLLVYQAITNIIADNCFDKIAPRYEHVLFGNIVNPTSTKEPNRSFFYKSWKTRWKNFNKITKDHFNGGYEYISEFDIASFFDTIDHNILSEVLRNTFAIDEDLVELLLKCLHVWTGDSNHKNFSSKHGIPQGPLSSPFLADIYLYHLDTEILKFKKLDFRYLRYVDDIRILSKDKLTSQKLIASLDLISRDLGLIPQGSKILIKKVTDIDKELKLQNSKFSNIVKEHRKDNEGKPKGKLKKKTHKKLKKRFLECFSEESNEFYLDKSVIGFSLFKLNKDEDIKNILLDKYELIQTQFDGVLFYLKKHYSTSQDVIDFLTRMINDEDILFHHLIALVFKHFPELPFDEAVYNRFNFKNHRHWLVNYFMIKWLFTNDKKELILIESDSTNYFIQRELNNYKFRISEDPMVRNLFIAKLMEEHDELIALQGLSLMFNDYRIFKRLELTGRQNSIIESIISHEPPDVILFKLKNEYNIENPETFFNRSIWSEDREYEELKSSFSIFTKIGNRDPSKSLMNLNIFNNLVFNKICERLERPTPSGEYGVNLNANILQDILPQLSRYWIEINEKRNQKTDAHPYDKFGEIRIKITKDEFNNLFSKEIQTLAEICNYRNY